MDLLIVIFSALILAGISLLLSKKIKNKYITITYATLLIVLVIIRSYLSDTFFNVLNGVFSDDGLTFIQRSDLTASLCRWGLLFATIVLPIAINHKNRFFKIIGVYIGMPFIIICTINFDNFMFYFNEISPNISAAYLSEEIRKIEFYLELIIILSMGIYIFVKDRMYKVKLKECLLSLAALPFMLAATIPVTVPQSLMGYSNLKFNLFSIGSICWFIGTFGIIISLYFIYRKKDEDAKWALVRFLALMMMIQFCACNKRGFDIFNLPLQLCNLGVFITFIAVAFKSQKLYDMLMIVNFQGAIIAMLVMNAAEDTGILSFWQMHYIFEHMFLVIIPVLAGSIGLFKLVNKKSLKIALIGFSIYYVFCVILGTFLNGYYFEELRTVDYFYIFGDTITDHFPFMQPFKSWSKIMYGNYVFYPIFYLAIYFVFGGTCFLTYKGIHYYYNLAAEYRLLAIEQRKLLKRWKNAKNNKLNKEVL